MNRTLLVLEVLYSDDENQIKKERVTLEWTPSAETLPHASFVVLDHRPLQQLTSCCLLHLFLHGHVWCVCLCLCGRRRIPVSSLLTIRFDVCSLDRHKARSGLCFTKC